MTVYTIGHSTRSLKELAQLLNHYSITQLIDVRSVPRSRHTPQFNADTIKDALQPYGISYEHIAQLGGLRHTTKQSINQGWHNTSFRGYADYMQTDDFAHGIDQLQHRVKNATTAIMCAEAVPWRCHRSMIGDALLVRDYQVIDIFDVSHSQAEKLTSFAKVDGTTITYPDDEPRHTTAS